MSGSTRDQDHIRSSAHRSVLTTGFPQFDRVLNVSNTAETGLIAGPAMSARSIMGVNTLSPTDPSQII
jgi:hypothetical protein